MASPCNLFKKIFHFNHSLIHASAHPFMEEPKNQTIHGKLNLNVPPLSTRRNPCSAADSGARPEPATMVPFSWERIPGEPKDLTTSDDSSSNDYPPPPKPPPGRWQPPFNDGDERFSDSIDIFSLAESVDDVEGFCKATRDRSLEMMEPPSFIIERFLPDAQALAEESVMNKRVPFSDLDLDLGLESSFSRSQTAMKGCGLGSLWQWRLKSKACSVKSPVCDAAVGGQLRQKR